MTMSEEPKIDLEEELRLAWPDGVPVRDRLVHDRLSTVRRKALARRLRAVRLWTETEGPHRPARLQDAAVIAAVSRTRFHQMASAWRENRSLASLGMHGGERTPRSYDVGGWPRGHLTSRLRDLLVQDPSFGLAEVRRRLRSEGLGRIADATLLRMMGEVRRTLAPSAFGAGLVLDSAGLDLVDPEGFRLRIFAVLDVGTGLVLGWAGATDISTASGGYIMPAHFALGGLAGLDLSRVPIAPTGPALDIAFHRDDVTGRTLLTSDEVGGRALPDSKPRGSHLVATVGERLGRTWLGTGERSGVIGFRSNRPVHLPPMTGPIMGDIGEAIDRHNAVRMLAGTDGAASRAEQEAAKSRVAARLEAIVGLENRLWQEPKYQ